MAREDGWEARRGKRRIEKGSLYTTLRQGYRPESAGGRSSPESHLWAVLTRGYDHVDHRLQLLGDLTARHCVYIYCSLRRQGLGPVFAGKRTTR